jgi:hypothetical protein
VTKKSFRLGLAAMGIGALCCVPGLLQSSWAAPKGPQMPFANSVEQRGDFIRELKEMNALLREQNALLKSGKLRVVIAEEDE